MKNPEECPEAQQKRAKEGMTQEGGLAQGAAPLYPSKSCLPSEFPSPLGSPLCAPALKTPSPPLVQLRQAGILTRLF
jgi:hypothetical protein